MVTRKVKELTLRKAQEYPVERYTDLTVVDQDLNVMTESMVRNQSHHANTKLVQELTEKLTILRRYRSMINHALAQLWTVTDGILMHDGTLLY